jgi:hypothetical protein
MFLYKKDASFSFINNYKSLSLKKLTDFDYYLSKKAVFII